MQVCETISDLRRNLALSRRQEQRIGLVPTMGALHPGHERLFQVARARCDVLVGTIFVNPLQFDRKEDFERYARTLPLDLDISKRAGVDLVFTPGVEEMYGRGTITTVEVGGLTDFFCGRSRPGHFSGVATVVSKLFHIVQPDAAWFGEKDAQQLAVIRRMVADLNFPIEIIGVPTVRESDGLALSSRNSRLSPEERQLAPRIYQALQAVKASVESGERETERALAPGLAILSDPRFSFDYFDLADAETMHPVSQVKGSVRAMAAVWLGGTRLIDNLSVYP